MTATLRPSGPEESPGHGARRRGYDICVNGRRAGGVELAAADEYGLLTGRIVRLAVDGADRRRGLAGLAALTAEEILRGWGCGRVVAGVPAAAGPARRLAAALGYTERSRHLLKDLTGGAGPALPEDGRLAPLSDGEYAAWRDRDHARLAAGLIADGVPRARAAAAMHRAQQELLPEGPATEGMALYGLTHGGTAAGVLWLRLDGAPRPDAHAWVYAVEVTGRHRGRGHGRTLMHAAEHVCREAGRRVLGLNVHAGNVPARTLYESLGYRPVEYHLGKALH